MWWGLVSPQSLSGWEARDRAGSAGLIRLLPCRPWEWTGGSRVFGLRLQSLLKWGTLSFLYAGDRIAYNFA